MSAKMRFSKDRRAGDVLWRGFGIARFLAAILVFCGVFLDTEVIADSRRNLLIHESPREIPAFQFEDAKGRSLTLNDFRGRVILLNLWATWCAPCLREMPILDELQASLDARCAEIVPLSVDRDGIRAVRKYYQKLGITHLGIFVGDRRDVLKRLGIRTLPITLIVDELGREIGRMVGVAEWQTPDSLKALVDTQTDEACQ